jgi:3-phenylpropionate/trans-cinnamate dioxygenase ferredoxin subunit
MDWIQIFSTSAEARNKVPVGKPRLLQVGSIRICLGNVDNALFAIEDKCSHNGESLSKGTINFLGEIICPWHGYRFKLNTGREFGQRSRDLITYQIRENENGVYLYI